MRRWGLALALLLSVGVNIGILVTLAVRRPAAVPSPGRGEEPPPRVFRLADRLGLEGEPRRRFLRLQGQFFADTVRLRTEQAEIFRELRRELTAPAPDRGRIEELTRASARAHLALQQALAKNALATREILDPGQERLFLDLLTRLPGSGLDGPPQRQRRPWLRRR